MRIRSGVITACYLALSAAGCSADEENDPSSPMASGGAGGRATDSGGPAPPLETATWHMLGYDLASTYHNPNETILDVDNVGDLEQKWELDAINPVTGAAAIVGGRVYILASSLFALDAANGDVIWKADFNGGSSPAYADGAIYAHGSGSWLARFDAETGDEAWRIQLSDHEAATGTSSPIVTSKYVVVGSSSGEEGRVAEGATFQGAVVALDRETGEEVWRHRTAVDPYNGASVWSTVSVNEAENVVFATTGNNYTGEAGPRSDSMCAIELDTGELIWNLQGTEGDVFTVLNFNGNPDDDFGANPFWFDWEIDGTMRKLVVAGQKSGTVWALDRTTGEVIWSRSLSGSNALLGGMLNNGAFDGERILVAANTATSDAPGGEAANGETNGDNVSVLTALDPGSGDTLWERQLPAAVWAPITTANGVGYVAYEKHLQAFDPRDGKKLFVFDVNGTITSAPAVTGGRVYLGSGMNYFAGHSDTMFHVLGLP